MDFLRREDEINAIVPGVTEVYRRLTQSHGQGVYTSMGRYYNHTIFGRDAGMTAKFVTHFDHNTAWDTILTLASYQGQNANKVTQEQPGRIHHEMRDYSSWNSNWFDAIGVGMIGYVWGRSNRKLLTYYAADTTATYIRLINKYTRLIDRSILDRLLPQADGQPIRLGQSVANAANWLMSQVDERGMFWVKRTNRWSLPYQTFADSVTAYAWSDGVPADSSRPHCFVEVQAYAIDALLDAARLMPHYEEAESWKMTAKKMTKTLVEDFWREDTQTFAPGLFSRRSEVTQLDSDMIMATWTLNTSFWQDLSEEVRQNVIGAIVKRVFKPDFLTDYGIRTKSMDANEPFPDMIDYHGSQTIWPMFNFMFIEGLRRHGLYRLARQVEYRLINTINSLGSFPEFFIVDHQDKLYRPEKHAKLVKPGQMIPEQNIAFTVVPALTLAYRHVYPRSTPADSGWQHDLEAEVLAEIPQLELLSPEDARQKITSEPLRIRRLFAGIRSAEFILPVMVRKPQND